MSHMFPYSAALQYDQDGQQHDREQAAAKQERDGMEYRAARLA
jgi:hypothetical protein